MSYKTAIWLVMLCVMFGCGGEKIGLISHKTANLEGTADPSNDQIIHPPENSAKIPFESYYSTSHTEELPRYIIEHLNTEKGWEVSVNAKEPPDGPDYKSWKYDKGRDFIVKACKNKFEYDEDECEKHNINIHLSIAP